MVRYACTENLTAYLHPTGGDRHEASPFVHPDRGSAAAQRLLARIGEHRARAGCRRTADAVSRRRARNARPRAHGKRHRCDVCGQPLRRPDRLPRRRRRGSGAHARAVRGPAGAGASARWAHAVCVHAARRPHVVGRCAAHGGGLCLCVEPGEHARGRGGAVSLRLHRRLRHRPAERHGVGRRPHAHRRARGGHAGVPAALRPAGVCAGALRRGGRHELDGRRRGLCRQRAVHGRHVDDRGPHVHEKPRLLGRGQRRGRDGALRFSERSQCCRVRLPRAGVCAQLAGAGRGA